MEIIKLIPEKKQLIPFLRFKGFGREWNKKELKDFTKINQGLQIAISERFTEKVEDSYFYITNEFLRKGAKKNYFIKNPPQSVICHEDDLLMTRTGNTGQVVTGVYGAFHNNFFKIKFDSSCEKWFLYYFLTSYRTQHTILKLAGTSTIPDLNHGDFYKIKINLPEYSEQQKIASFLSAIDEKIQQLTRKKELLEQNKKGVMQQLFSGKLRFKDENGKAYPSWEKRKLGDVADVKRGAASQHLNYVSDETKGVRLLRINDFLSDGAVYVENTEEMKRYTVKTNDLLIAGTGATAGIIFIVPEKFNNLSFSYNAPRIRVTKAYHTFIYYYLKSDVILKQQKRLFVGNAQPFLDTDAMRGFKIDLPSIEEQKKIATYLSSIDTKIESVTTQINKSQTFKKGLLQQMFV